MFREQGVLEAMVKGKKKFLLWRKERLNRGGKRQIGGVQKKKENNELREKKNEDMNLKPPGLQKEKDAPGRIVGAPWGGKIFFLEGKGVTWQKKEKKIGGKGNTS